MNINLLKHLPLAAVCLSSAAFAGMDIDTRVSQLEMQMKQVRTSTDSKRFGAKTAEAGPMIVDGYDVTIGLGAIYQSAALAGTDYAYTEQGRSPTTVDFIPLDGSIKEPESAWAWGINAILGFNFERDGWDLRLTNSYYDTNETNTIEAGYGGVVVPSRVLSGLIEASSSHDFVACAEATSKLGVAYDLLGIELGRDYFVSSHLALRPNYGLLASWLWNDQKIDYSGDPITSLAILQHNIYKVHDRSEWFGIGPQFGLGSTWGLGKGFSIFADTKGALMYGRFKTTHTEELVFSEPSSSDADYSLDVSSNSRRIVPYIQSILGVSYSCFSDDNKNHFLIRLGYNVQFFFSANQFIYPSMQYGANSVESEISYTIPQFRNTFNNLQTSGLILDAAWSF